jgi:hypothetical protein
LVLRRLSWYTITATANQMVRVVLQNADAAGANVNAIYTLTAQANASGSAFGTETFDPPLIFGAGRVPCVLAFSNLTSVTEATGMGYLTRAR